MLEIKNLLFQPLTLHLADSNKSVHLGSREKIVIKENDLSLEIKKAQARGWVSIKNIVEQTAKEPAETTKKKKEDKS